MTAVRAFVIAALFAAVLTLVAVVWWDSTRAVTVVVTGNSRCNRCGPSDGRGGVTWCGFTSCRLPA
ncbi:MAG: hypothetical protein ACR2OU_09555 [Thermomicrobiales bacterium]